MFFETEDICLQIFDLHMVICYRPKKKLLEKFIIEFHHRTLGTFFFCGRNIQKSFPISLLEILSCVCWTWCTIKYFLEFPNYDIFSGIESKLMIFFFLCLIGIFSSWLSSDSLVVTCIHSSTFVSCLSTDHQEKILKIRVSNMLVIILF